MFTSRESVNNLKRLLVVYMQSSSAFNLTEPALARVASKIQALINEIGHNLPHLFSFTQKSAEKTRNNMLFSARIEEIFTVLADYQDDDTTNNIVLIANAIDAFNDCCRDLLGIVSEPSTARCLSAVHSARQMFTSEDSPQNCTPTLLQTAQAV